MATALRTSLRASLLSNHSGFISCQPEQLPPRLPSKFLTGRRLGTHVATSSTCKKAIRQHTLTVTASAATKEAVKGTELEAVSRFSEVVPDTVVVDDFERFPPTAATVTSSLLLGIASLPDARYEGAIESALAYGKCYLENKGPSRMSCFMDKALVNVGAELAKLVPGRVSTEIDPRLAHDKEGILNQVHRLLDLYDEVKVPRNRLLFKIPATWEGIEAARALEAEGVQTHVTLVYSFAQAATCAQADISVIQVFVGRLRDWARTNKGDPGIDKSLQRGEDPGLALVSRTYDFVHKHGFKSTVMASALRNKQDVFSILGVDYMVVPVKILRALQESPAELDEEHSYQRRLSPSGAQSAEFSTEELSVLTKESFQKGLGPCAEQLLASGLESQVGDIRRVEEYFDKIWPPPNV